MTEAGLLPSAHDSVVAKCLADHLGTLVGAWVWHSLPCRRGAGKVPVSSGALSRPQTAAPNSRPTAAVTPIATTPQNPTRAAPIHGEAPPAAAAIAPSPTRHTSDTAPTSSTSADSGARNAASSGTPAPDGEGGGRGHGSLERPGGQLLGQTELVARVGGERPRRRELLRHGARENRA